MTRATQADEQGGAGPARTTPAWRRDGFVSRVLFIIAAAAIALALYRLSVLFILVAAAIVVAALIHLIADPMRRRLGFSPKLAAAAAVGLLLVALAGAGWLFGATIAAQFDALAARLPQAIRQLQEAAAQGPFGRAVQTILSGGGPGPGDIAGFLRNMIGGVFTALVYLVATVTAGIIFAMYPALYRDGALYLLPPSRRGQAREAANISGRALKGWLVGQLIAMAIIGVLTSIGLMLIGIQSWLALGLLAGLAQFVPLIGPILSAIPGLIIAGATDASTLLQALAVYVGVQQLESNLITPYVMRKAASLPMALTLFSIVGFALLFGPLGALIATPATVVIYVMVQKLYVEETLGDDVAIKGERPQAA